MSNISKQPTNNQQAQVKSTLLNSHITLPINKISELDAIIKGNEEYFQQCHKEYVNTLFGRFVFPNGMIAVIEKYKERFCSGEEDIKDYYILTTSADNYTSGVPNTDGPSSRGNQYEIREDLEKVKNFTRKEVNDIINSKPSANTLLARTVKTLCFSESTGEIIPEQDRVMKKLYDTLSEMQSYQILTHYDKAYLDGFQHAITKLLELKKSQE